MFLSREEMAAGKFFKDDVVRCYGSNSYDLRLERAREIRPEKSYYDLTKEHSEDNYHDLETLLRTRGGNEYEVFRLFKGSSIIVSSMETVNMPQGFVGICSPRSNLSYILDFQHSLLIDTGFKGVITARISSPFQAVDIPKYTRFLQVMIAESMPVDQFYTERESSKNLDQTREKKIKYKVDKEFRF